MSKIAFIFPGQGAQYVGMAQDFYNQFPESREIFEKANASLDFDILNMCFENEKEIGITEYTQPAIVAAECAVLAAINSKGYKPDVCAGLSLGEYSAMVASKVMSFEDAVKTVRQRGILMQKTVPAGEGTMAAVLKLDKEVIEKVCEETEGTVSIANYNCPGQIVITGETDAVNRASEALKEAGARRVIPLKVSGPFHSPMLKEAGEKLTDVLKNVNINKPEVPYIANYNADYVTEATPVKELLSKQVYNSVRWEQTLEKMHNDGVDTFVEIGPGKTLAGFLKKMKWDDITVISIDKVEELDNLSNIK